MHPASSTKTFAKLTSPDGYVTQTAPACYAVHVHGGKQNVERRLTPFPTLQDQSKPGSPRSRDHGADALWMEQRGSREVAENVRGALQAITRNEEFINMTLAVLMTPVNGLLIG